MAKKSSNDVQPRNDETPEDRLRAHIARLDPATQKLVLSLRAALRKRLPAANELVYDYANSLVVCYSPSDRGIEGIVSLAARADGVRLYFMNGPRLPDPTKLLQGLGKDARYVSIDSARRLADPAIESLVAAALRVAGVPLPTSGKGAVIIKDNGAKRAKRAKSAATKSAPKRVGASDKSTAPKATRSSKAMPASTARVKRPTKRGA
ncbi:MAG: DUF1801 domain-containing protein [Phycisphaerae bacterium]|nr:DUF1801 domain-containing protein [Phycisphaerae bacterium]